MVKTIADLEREFYLKHLYPNPDPDPDPDSAYFPTFAVGEPITESAGLELINFQWFIESSTPTDYAVLLTGLVEDTAYISSSDMTGMYLAGIVRILANDGSVLPDAFPPGSYSVGVASYGQMTFNESAFTDQFAGFEGTGLTYEFVGYGLMWSSELTLPFTITEEV